MVSTFHLSKDKVKSHQYCYSALFLMLLSVQFAPAILHTPNAENHFGKRSNPNVCSNHLAKNNLPVILLNTQEPNKLITNDVSNIKIIIIALSRYYHYSDSFNKDIHVTLKTLNKQTLIIIIRSLPAKLHNEIIAYISGDGKSTKIGHKNAHQETPVGKKSRLWPAPKEEVVAFPKPGDNTLKSLEATKIALTEYEKRFPTNSKSINVRTKYIKRKKAWEVSVMTDKDKQNEKTAIIQVNKDKVVKILSSPKLKKAKYSG